MIPDLEKELNERMGRVSLKELMPDFDKEQQWGQLSQNLPAEKKRPFIPVWSYAAAILLLLIGAWFTWQFTHTHDQPIATQHNIPAKQDAAIKTLPDNKILAVDTFPKSGAVIAVAKKHELPHKGHSANKSHAKDVIRNGTPCPIQICISQTVKCPNRKPASISTCSTLEPDQSEPLNYQANESVAKNCSLTIKEIEIKSIATGETILLNASSSPSTASEVFSYITGQKKGDVLAGMFTSDCNHQTVKKTLRLDNRYGDIIIQ